MERKPSAAPAKTQQYRQAQIWNEIAAAPTLEALGDGLIEEEGTEFTLSGHNYRRVGRVWYVDDVWVTDPRFIILLEGIAGEVSP